MAARMITIGPRVCGDEAFVRALHERTDGVPLFVASVLSDITAGAEQGAYREGDGGRAWTEARAVGGSVLVRRAGVAVRFHR